MDSKQMFSLLEKHIVKMDKVMDEGIPCMHGEYGLTRSAFVEALKLWFELKEKVGE